MCVCAKDPSRRAACGKLRENVDLTPGAARRGLLGWRRRRRPSRRTRRAAAPVSGRRAAALPPARTRRPASSSGPASALAGPGRCCTLRFSPFGPRARRPAPGARSQTEVRAAGTNNVPLCLAWETCLLCASCLGVDVGGGGKPRVSSGSAVYVQPDLRGDPRSLGLLAPSPALSSPRKSLNRTTSPVQPSSPFLGELL